MPAQGLEHIEDPSQIPSQIRNTGLSDSHLHCQLL